MVISISNEKTSHDYYNVPNKVAKAIITLLEECGNSETKIVTAESENQPLPIKNKKRTYKKQDNDDWSGAQGNISNRISKEQERGFWGIYG